MHPMTPIFSGLIGDGRSAQVAMRLGSCVLIALWVSLAPRPSLLAQSQPCNNLPAVPGDMGYRYRLGPARCEGLYQSPVAGESLEFLSLVTVGISYDLHLDKVLVVAVPDVTRFGASQVNVQARALPLGTYYRMDATVGSAKSMEWPLSTVIAQAQIQSDSIGVIGWIEKGGTKIYVPVSVLAKGKPSRPSHSTIAVLRSTIDIEKVDWRLWVEGNTAQPPSWQILGGNVPSAFRAGDPIKLKIDAASQHVDLEIAAKMKGSDNWLKTRQPLFIP